MVKPIKQRVLKSGVVIAGKYRIEKPIARGGFSIIYRAVHVDMDRDVGLKILQLGDNIRAAWLERFSREARLASQLTHPNTVTIFDYGQDDRGFLYLAMEWIDGDSLYKIFEERGALDTVEVAQIARQILASLDEAHRRGILHRDLKPSNIMLTKNYEGRRIVKVLDFGIAKIFGGDGNDDATITREGGFVGTPRYAAPEQLDGKALSPRADIYAVGLLMWEALVGDPAVPGIEYGECVKYHASPEPWQLPEAPAFPPELTRIIQRALEKDPEDRYSSARSMHDDLAAWLESDEAREGGFSPTAGGEFFVPDRDGLAESTSDPADEPADDLFADLSSGVPSDEVPMDLEGPESSRSGPPPFPNKASDERGKRRAPESREGGATSRPPSTHADSRTSEPSTAQSGTDRDPGMKRESRPSTHAPQGEQGPEPSDQQGAGAVRGAGPGGPARAQSRRAPSDAVDEDAHKMQKIVVGLAVGAIVIAALVAIFQVATGDDESSDNSADSEAATSVDKADRDDLDESGEADFAAEETAEESENPTMSVDAILVAMRRSGWRQQGEINRLELSDATQHSGLFRAGENSVAITIFESPSHAMARDIVEKTTEGQRVVRFGKNVVRLRPASGPGKKRATKKLTQVLQTFRDAAK